MLLPLAYHPPPVLPSLAAALSSSPHPSVPLYHTSFHVMHFLRPCICSCCFLRQMSFFLLISCSSFTSRGNASVKPSYISYIYIYFFVEPYMSETFLYILFCFIWPCILVNCLNVCTSPAHHQIVNILIVLRYYICLHFSSCPACRRYPNKHLLSEFPGER